MFSFRFQRNIWYWRWKCHHTNSRKAWFGCYYKMAVIGGYDRTTKLDSVEFYKTQTQKWEMTDTSNSCVPTARVWIWTIFDFANLYQNFPIPIIFMYKIIPHRLFLRVLNRDYTITSRGFLNFLSFNMILTAIITIVYSY